MYNHPCEYCSGGRVECVVMPRELIRVGKTGFVALEQAPIGVCTRCKAKYYHASVIRQAESLLHRRRGRVVKVPVGRFVEAG
ncbi:MAG: hypothetical protein FD180_56 [Planctomycetota bacterium]|nr:MAG: hypothetical protein FD180_56 [Planctomycetota bacterium]